MFGMLASTIVGLLGSYFFYRGLKIQNTKMIIWGVVLIVLSYFVFSGSGSNDSSKDVIKTLMPSNSSQQSP